MKPVSEDIKNLLDGESELGLTFGTDLFIGRGVEQVKNCVVIYDTTTMPDRLGYDVNDDYSFHAFQILVKNKSYLDGMALAYQIKELLHGIANQTIGDKFYTSIRHQNGPICIEWTENNLAKIIMNFETQFHK